MDPQTMVMLIFSAIGAIIGGYAFGRQGTKTPDRSERYLADAGNGLKMARPVEMNEATKSLTDSNLNLSIVVSQLVKQAERDEEGRAELHRQVRGLESNVSKLEGTIEALKETIGHYEREAGILQSRIYGLEQENARKTKEIHALQTQLDTVNELLKQRTQERDEAVNQVRNLEQKMIDMSLRLDKYESTQKKQTSELNKLEEKEHES